jgi:hypothetical protein
MAPFLTTCFDLLGNHQKAAFKIFSEIFFILKRILWDVFINMHIFLTNCKILKKLCFLKRLLEDYLILNLMRILLVWADLFHADGETWQGN